MARSGAAFSLSPLLRGEGAEDRRFEAGEGLSQMTRAPLTRLDAPRLATLSPQLDLPRIGGHL